MESRTRDEAGCCSGLDRRRTQKAERAFGRKNGWATLIESSSKNETEEERSNSQKKEESGGTKNQRYLEIKVSAIERRAKGLRRDGRGGWSMGLKRQEETEKRHRKG
jgi:hypothetical protein